MSETSVAGFSSTSSTIGRESDSVVSTRSSTLLSYLFDGSSLGRLGGVSGVGVLMATREANVC